MIKSVETIVRFSVIVAVLLTIVLNSAFFHAALLLSFPPVPRQNPIFLGENFSLSYKLVRLISALLLIFQRMEVYLVENMEVESKVVALRRYGGCNWLRYKICCQYEFFW